MRRRSKKVPWQMLALITQLGITMLVAVGISGWIGLKLATYFQKEWIFLLFLVMGCMAGIRSCYGMIKKFI